MDIVNYKIKICI